jgi:hypothetical protein
VLSSRGIVQQQNQYLQEGDFGDVQVVSYRAGRLENQVHSHFEPLWEDLVCCSQPFTDYSLQDFG